MGNSGISAFLELHPARLLKLLEKVDLVDSVVLFQRVESTNLIASRFLEYDLKGSILIIAEEQTRGRGRKGRAWHSTAGSSLTFTVVLPVKGHEEHLAEITPVFAISIVNALEKNGLSRVMIKWPNDILVGGKKLCGILAEAKGTGVIVGVGLNVNEESSELSIVDIPATSLRIELGRTFDRGRVLSDLLVELDSNLKTWKGEYLVAFKESIERKLMYSGEEVSVVDGGKGIRGRVVGITDDGRLRLNVSGKEVVISSGDVSLRR